MNKKLLVNIPSGIPYRAKSLESCNVQKYNEKNRQQYWVDTIQKLSKETGISSLTRDNACLSLWNLFHKLPDGFGLPHYEITPEKDVMISIKFILFGQEDKEYEEKSKMGQEFSKELFEDNE